MTLERKEMKHEEKYDNIFICSPEGMDERERGLDEVFQVSQQFLMMQTPTTPSTDGDPVHPGGATRVKWKVRKQLVEQQTLGTS